MSTESPTKDNLNKSLHPEWINSRLEPAYGKKQFYLQGHNAIKLANEMFGRDGWKKEIKNTVEDFSEVLEDGSVMVSMAATVRVTLLKTGTFHEDVGYGIGEHATTKRTAMEKARFAAAFDGMKRALRKFGNSLGNCLYDTNYLQHVESSVAPPPRPPTTHLWKQQPTTTMKRPAAPSPQQPTTTCNQIEHLHKRQHTTSNGHQIKKESLNTTKPQPYQYTKKQSFNTTTSNIGSTIQQNQPSKPNITSTTMTCQKKPTITSTPKSTSIPSSSIVTPLSLTTRIKNDKQSISSAPSAPSPSSMIKPPQKSSTMTCQPNIIPTPEPSSSIVTPLSLTTRIKNDKQSIPSPPSSSSMTKPPQKSSTMTCQPNIIPTPETSSPIVTPLSLMTRIKNDNQPISSVPSPPSSSSMTKPPLDTDRPPLVSQDSFPFDDIDEEWLIHMTDPILLQRTCRENSSSHTSKSDSPCHH